MVELNHDEMEVIYNFIAETNWYEQMNILSRTYSEQVLARKKDILLRVMRKIDVAIDKEKTQCTTATTTD